MIIPIMKNNRNQENNKRDIIIALAWTWLIDNLVGIFGAISIAGSNIR
jgi:hypothetical protein